MTKKEHPEELDKSSAVHDEHADINALALLSSDVKYDAGKLRDLIHNPYAFGAALLASFGGFSFGYGRSFGVISIILVMSQFRQQFPETSPDHAHDSFNVGLMTGMLELGAFIGCLSFPAVADRISRKWGLTVATFLFVIGATIQTAAQDYATIVAGRFIGGIGVGTLAMGAPLYISEISQLFGEIAQTVAARREGATGIERNLWVDLFRPKYLRKTVVALAIPFFQQFSGINAFVYYAPTFFEALGQSDNNSLILSGMVNVCQFVGGVPMMLYLDEVGRRKLAIYGGIAMAIPHLVMAGLMNRFSSDWASHQAVGWFCVALIYLYVLSYSISYGPLAWVLPAEVFPSSKRAKGVGAATGMIWLANFIIGVVVPEMLLKLGWGTYLFFGIFCVAAAVFSFFLVPETSNKSLEQVAAVFGDELIDEERNLQSRIAGGVWHGYGSHAEKEARV
ncbi:general substrate transporter [Aspergillus neoniger CBS 115656]|uniref:General substrate transporter n=1 Tax=Aspergillus neoniger (strain CBS 115656) TaxID=1448310 RepID=A0A318YK26_ASPNB|nr:general substrate transporter [Aspergillus neoniger CBS 115656]PYH34167.1 general substrate transporter [Aspergillus neoniger CBS 115656]